MKTDEQNADVLWDIDLVGTIFVKVMFTLVLFIIVKYNITLLIYKILQMIVEKFEICIKCLS